MEQALNHSATLKKSIHYMFVTFHLIVCFEYVYQHVNCTINIDLIQGKSSNKGMCCFVQASLKGLQITQIRSKGLNSDFISCSGAVVDNLLLSRPDIEAALLNQTIKNKGKNLNNSILFGFGVIIYLVYQLYLTDFSLVFID